MQRVYSHVAELRNLSQTLHGIPSRIKNPSPLEGTLYRIHSKIPSPSVHISLKQKWRGAWITFVVPPDPVQNNVRHVQSGFWKRFFKLVWQLLWDFQGSSQLECNSVSVWCTYLGSSLTSFVHSMGGAHTWYEMKIPACARTFAKKREMGVFSSECSSTSAQVIPTHHWNYTSNTV